MFMLHFCTERHTYNSTAC